MLSMFKGKKGFSVLFQSAEKDTAAPLLSADTAAGARRSGRVSGTVGRSTGGSGVAQLQCQRCSKRFSALEEDSNEAQSCCRRCGYPTCPQCREAIAGTPPWVCCVCDGPKSFMWLLERTKMGPRLVSKIVEFCDPRGQRLMRSMFRFTLQQYRAVSSPRPSLTIGAGGRPSGSRAGSGGVLSPFRPANSPTPPAAAAAVSKSRTALRASGERGASSTGLCALSASHGNAAHQSPYSHPKHASLLRPADRLHTVDGSAATGGKENSLLMSGDAVQVSESPQRPRGSEVLRRDDAVGVVEYSPAPNREVGSDSAESSADDVSVLAHTQPPPQQQPVSRAEDRCTAVQDIYRVSDANVTPRSTLTTRPTTEEVSASPHVRPSGHAAFQREVLHQPPPNHHRSTNNVNVDSDLHASVAAETEAVSLTSGATATSVTPTGQPCSSGRSFSPASSRSSRSESPAPRFPTFAQFLDDRAAVGTGQTHLPRESDVLVTVSPDSSAGGEEARDSSVMELGGARNSRPTLKSSNHNDKGSLRTPRGTQPCTPLSAAGSSSRRTERRTSGLSGDFTPTRALDLSDARATVRRGSSSRRRNTGGSLAEMPAPHLYRGSGRRSGQVGDSPFMYELPSLFSSGGGGGDGGVAAARGPMRRQHAPLVTRTAGRPLGGVGPVHDARVRLARLNSRTVTPLQRVPSGARSLARMNSSTAPFARKNSATTRGVGFGRLNSGTAQLTRTPSSRTRLVGVPLSPDGRGLPRTETTKLVRTASALCGLPQPRAAAPAAGTAMERTHSRYGLAVKASPLKRTASHTELGGQLPFCRVNSAAAFARSATATAAFTRTNSAAVFGRGAMAAVAASSSSAKHGAVQQHPHSAVAGAFARTATGTYLYGGKGRYPATTRITPAGLAHHPAAASTGPNVWRQDARPLSSARKNAPVSRAGAASPLHRTNTATRNPAPVNGGAGAAARGPRRLSTGYTRAATNPRPFERLPSHPLRQPTSQQQQPQQRSAGGVRTTVDPAPALVGVARRTPSAMSRTDSAVAAAAPTAATPRTPRPYIIASVSTAATPAAAATHGVNGGVRSGGGVRPVLSSSSVSSPKQRNSRTRGSGSGSGGATRTSGDGGVLSSVSSTPVVKAPSGMALAGRSSAPRRRPGTASGAGTPTTTAAEGACGVKGKAFVRLNTGTRSGTATAGKASREARTLPGPAHAAGGFTRLNSRSAI
ncbi:hypothetical protein ABB37_09072 [Leptomonas pyrrhocoris]|uniref:FYVE-type domain-containing protein n=1 Tax=Leptomonas pyrrhocoris TaxID=157538 RepID=A0A0N0DRJ6_LEPPY|nr:hypothetical protein ABB37_09072 [Leptomonas pyrrhocoris]XP_015653231.1 hypothetical protein ABB37_09072 [Leptomonas pyrrhocoris]KPA74791.1 hypothetical protein ABB37_09072 [Leptomonas pyrrhocoris]KPA74792.1 hypothetical protein ABB37_09072 [Leptomonas pyrrhocoris]|eukprot:XP_015653230.1 hypothetical protein ABB37_09072 [Leptomonas pyrrhocoris]